MKIDRHHIFSQGTKRGWRRKKYRQLLDSDTNTVFADHLRHIAGRVLKRGEREFLRSEGLLDEKYCKKFHTNGCKSCTWYYGFEADECRNFEFSLEKYEEAQG